MFRFLFPTDTAPSAYDYDYEKAFSRGIRGILFDIDNTLVPHDAPADRRAAALVKRLKDTGFSVMVVSNNEEPRVRSFAALTGADHLCRAMKPLPGGIRKAISMMGLSKASVLLVGDQLFTDILGANLAGIESLLVRPLDLSTDTPKIRFKRRLEYPVLKMYLRQKRLAKNS